MVQLRIISDIHFDSGLNANPDGDKVFGEIKHIKNEVNLLAGDIAATPGQVKAFLKKYIGKDNETFFISGNHDVYNYARKDINELKGDLKKEYSKNEHWHYLNNDWAWVPYTDNQIAIIGSPFYTDYGYNCFKTVEERNIFANTNFDRGTIILNPKTINEFTPEQTISDNMEIASAYLNDFYWGRIYDKENKGLRRLRPSDYLEMNKEAYKKILECYKEIIVNNPKGRVILMTHHPLTPLCLSEEYEHSFLNSSYVSDVVDELLMKMPNLFLIISGHVHNRASFDLINPRRKIVKYILNPCGYIRRDENKEGIPFDINFIIDTDELI